MTISTTSWILAFIPFTSGLILPPLVSRLLGKSTSFRPSCKETSKCKQRTPSTPPGYLFGVMWVALYALLGVTWVWARESAPADSLLYDVLFAIMVFLLFAWTIRYSEGTRIKESVTTLYFNFLYAAMVWTVLLTRQNQAAITLTPLITWLIFALQLDIAETNFYIKPESF